MSAASPSTSPAGQADSPESPPKVPEYGINWSCLAPYLTVRLFTVEPESESWESKHIELAEEIASHLPDVIRCYPPKERRRGESFKGMPLDIGVIEASFIDVQEQNLSESLAASTVRATPGLVTVEPSVHVWMAGALYRTEGPPFWLKHQGKGKEVKDVKHHLVLLTMMPPYLGLCATQSAVFKMIGGFLEVGEIEEISLARPLPPLAESLLDRTFVGDEVYRLWLSGLHRSVVTKPDKKTLYGPDLRHALDPYAEQTFTYSAVISRLGDILEQERDLPVRQSEENVRLQTSVGFSKSTHSIWTSKTRGIVEFAGRFAILRRALLRAKQGKEPKSLATDGGNRLGLNYLSQPVAPEALEEAKDPFEISLDLGEPGADGEVADDEMVSDREKWRTRGWLELCPDDDPDLPEKPTPAASGSLIPARALYLGEPIAYFWLSVTPATEELSVDISAIRRLKGKMKDEDGESPYDLLDRLLESDRRAENSLVVRYETGHVLAGNRLYKPGYEDLLYDGWRGLKLSKGGRSFDVSKEKPKGWRDLGRTKRARQARYGNSLFAFVVHDAENLFAPSKGNDWFLLCHDQANEVADFVYLEPQQRRVVLVHVKGANGKDTTRRVSLTAYEVVLQQAVKNLRHLNVGHLADRILGSGKHDRECGVFCVTSSAKEPSTDCTPFAEALREFQATGFPALKKQVAVLQPHVRMTQWRSYQEDFEREKDPGSVSSLRPAYMLSSLLIETEIACRKQGVDFQVWTEDDTGE